MATPDEVVRSCLCLHIRQASRVITQIYDAALRPAGLRATQFAILVALHETGEVPLTRLAGAMAVERTTLTRNLVRLERRGLVGSIPGSDGRERRLRITGEGRSLVWGTLANWEEAQSRIFSLLGESAAALVTNLRRTVSAAKSA